MKRSSISILVVMVFLAASVNAFAADNLTCWFPPSWKTKTKQAKVIADALTNDSQITVRPRIAKNYPQILNAFSSDAPSLVYVGSFVQTVIHARGIGEPLVQNIDGKEMYSGILIYPRGKDPRKLLQESPEKIAFAVGASSGESSAKAATAGKARFRTPSHTATAGSVRAGKAVAGFVKNWWWQSNKHKYPDLEACDIPGVSELKNPDNVLAASQAVSYEVRKRIAVAAMRNREAFGASEMIPFDSTKLEFSLSLMKKGGIDPSTYTWK